MPRALSAFLSGCCWGSLAQQVFVLSFRLRFQKNLGPSFDILPQALEGRRARESKPEAGPLHPGTVGLSGHKHQSLGVIRKWRILYLL